ncbi:nitric oxide dioxygenase [Nocardioides daedukensis]|uniref:Nitric oxide dioxygenase n=1 Tax=Nocardioides daedukensis TaxID=634462 RepID=A0A7Y9S324_9ACTN|nr:globin domain-containing protein [Nocardioides daedukensis]NYG60109.1 nitric oxide dioxygenase [Nocardioides daedukensis]
MTPHQVHLVQSTFELVLPIADDAAIIFYDDLFTRAPELRSLFAEDMTEQRVKLMKTLGVAVNALADWESVAPTVAELGAKHAGHGARAEDYATVGAALLQTLATGLGETFTDEVAAAWAEYFEVVASTMLAGQRAAA